eukprot:scaffold22448_cov146-Isochrysis_galbana.AAC.2
MQTGDASRSHSVLRRWARQSSSPRSDTPHPTSTQSILAPAAHPSRGTACRYGSSVGASISHVICHSLSLRALCMPSHFLAYEMREVPASSDASLARWPQGTRTEESILSQRGADDGFSLSPTKMGLLSPTI